MGDEKARYTGLLVGGANDEVLRREKAKTHPHPFSKRERKALLIANPIQKDEPPLCKRRLIET
ncbi:hypothetical protein HMPREF1991_02432 [Hoylesella loescheii DSM 19665 = JCM 12249 = ATCC 15930]|uniref:Uncharacterized protein n=1 Tax=Hoylesella loescheii DSM 19665 = JCM 12249 = ATCC 15930 TaxID=1122985 RepID=A0A069QFC9_HOYLO|nr:hypothetical protein HMPREF1991_02432 [Hoylesella loescheii DSM 19665 = JCM 12249 = ATCC 15930]